MLPHLVGANGQNLGECHVPQEYLNQLRLSILEYGPESKFPVTVYLKRDDYSSYLVNTQCMNRFKMGFTWFLDL